MEKRASTRQVVAAREFRALEQHSCTLKRKSVNGDGGKTKAMNDAIKGCAVAIRPDSLRLTNISTTNGNLCLGACTTAGDDIGRATGFSVAPHFTMAEDAPMRGPYSGQLPPMWTYPPAVDTSTKCHVMATVDVSTAAYRASTFLEFLGLCGALLVLVGLVYYSVPVDSNISSFWGFLGLCGALLLTKIFWYGFGKPEMAEKATSMIRVMHCTPKGLVAQGCE
ncbi:hypothetical protein C8R43DRAFT_964790 [Mycena crocata]|nr:hypothetical protein C8R43DRAFT_964790 [Mycena crocata]